jgi:hypothetical protein|uniref:hypothetical protein n=1 Tax=Segatella copri TaxID=165179 RepID=UPI0035646902
METKKIARFRFTALAHTFDSWDEVISYYERLVERGECVVLPTVSFWDDKVRTNKWHAQVKKNGKIEFTEIEK